LFVTRTGGKEKEGVNIRFKAVCLAVGVVITLMLISVPVAGDDVTINEDKTSEELGLWLIVTYGQDVLLPPTMFNVDYLDPREYGIDRLDMVSGINGAQLFIKAHELEFGKENVTSAMNMRRDGWLYRFWDIEDMVDGYYVNYMVNGHIPNTCTTNIPMKEGGMIHVFFYKFGTGGQIRSFDNSSQRVITGENVTWTLNGWESTDPDVTASETSVWLYVDGVNDIELGKTDKKGKLSYAFDEAGTYWVYSYGAKTTVAWTQVIVRDIYTSGIEINEDSANLLVGETIDLDATVSPSNADVTGVQWSSSRKDVASVSKDGVVKAIAPGRSIITARTLDGDFVTSCEISVNYENTGYENNGDSGKTILYVGVGAICMMAVAVVVMYAIKR